MQNKNSHVVQRRRILGNEPERTAEDSLLLDAVKTWRRGSGSASDDSSKWRCGRRRGEHPATTTDVGHGIDSLPRRKKENYQSIWLAAQTLRWRFFPSSCKETPATLQLADHRANLPLHECCRRGTVDFFSVQYFVQQQGGVGTLAACNHQGELPLHCSVCVPPSSAASRISFLCLPEPCPCATHSGKYPFLLAAAAAATDSYGGTSSLSVVYELVRANPDVRIVPLRKPI